MFQPPTEANRLALTPTLDDSDSNEYDDIDSIIDSVPNQRVQAPSQPPASKKRMRKMKDNYYNSYSKLPSAELTTKTSKPCQKE